MNENSLSSGDVRKLIPAEAEAVLEHYLRLDRESRRLRFSHNASDAFIEEYVARMSAQGDVVHAFVEDGKVRAVAELHKLGDRWGDVAEAAFSVEKSYQDRGVGTALMGRVIRSARNRGVQHIALSCLSENAKMQSIVRKYEGALRFAYGEVVGRIVPAVPNIFSFFAEAVADWADHFSAAFDVESRTAKAVW